MVSGLQAEQFGTRVVNVSLKTLVLWFPAKNIFLVELHTPESSPPITPAKQIAFSESDITKSFEFKLIKLEYIIIRKMIILNWRGAPRTPKIGRQSCWQEETNTLR